MLFLLKINGIYRTSVDQVTGDLGTTKFFLNMMLHAIDLGDRGVCCTAVFRPAPCRIDPCTIVTGNFPLAEAARSFDAAGDRGRPARFLLTFDGVSSGG